MYGIQIFNDDYVLTVDANSKQYELYEEGTSTVDGPTTINLTTNTNKNIIVAFKPSTDGFCNVCHYTKNGSNYNGFILSTNTSLSIQWKVFIEIENNATVSGVSFDIFDENGDPCFNINKTGVSIVSHPVSSISLNAEVTVDDSTNYFYIDAYYYNISYTKYSDYQYFTVNTLGLKVVNSTKLSLGYVLRRSEYTGTPPGTGGSISGNRGGIATGGRLIEIK